MNRWAYLLIALSAALWGTIGLFVKELYELGLSPLEVVALRVSCAAIILFSYALLTNRKLLVIQIKDSKYFIGTGIVSIAFFNWCFFVAIQETSISIAAILLYTAPAFVLLFSRMLFQEVLSKRKLLSLTFTFTGCVLVVELFPLSSLNITTLGILAGLGSGLFYALYSIFGKFALKKYSSFTVTIYTFVFAALFIVPISQFWNSMTVFSEPKVWLYGVSLGLFPTVLAFILYTKGLEQVEVGKASIIATLEPVVAAVIGLIFYNEILSFWQYVGVILVISAVIVIQSRSKKTEIYEINNRRSL